MDRQADIRRLTTLSEGNDKGAACKAISEYMGGSSLEERLATLRAIADLNKVDRQKNPDINPLFASVHFTDQAALPYMGTALIEGRGMFSSSRLVIEERVETDAFKLLPRVTYCGDKH